MEARKTKLAAQLASLNSVILTSEFSRSEPGGKPAGTTPRKKRPRISDFSAPASGGLGLIGLGTPTNNTSERRVVSTFHHRIPEEIEMEVPPVPVVESLDPNKVSANSLLGLC